MNQNYHYFVIKTLAHYAGLPEEAAQITAWYSQQVDSFILSMPVYTQDKPSDYLLKHGYARSAGKNRWFVIPHPTGINVGLSLVADYQRTTLAPFHFLPARPLAELEQKENFSRADYRCVPACEGKELLIHELVEEALAAVENEPEPIGWMQLGMTLHTYADTYAHCGFSGLEGWENKAAVKKAFNQSTGKEEVSPEKRFVYECLPPIGHAHAGHVPDVCTYQLQLAMQKEAGSAPAIPLIERDNNAWFLQCALELTTLLCRAAHTPVPSGESWAALADRLSRAMMVIPSGDETKTAALVRHWHSLFPEISYDYNPNQRFYSQQAVPDFSLESIHLNQEFFLYNELAYRRAEKVTGSDALLAARSQTVLQQEDYLSQSAFLDAAPAFLDGAVSAAPGPSHKMPATEEWQPCTGLGNFVYAAGFTYLPAADIIGSTMNNLQRLGGYCRAYDEGAIAIASVIDCEPIYFCYDGREWMMELWKGQYGIETGCEIGLYYRPWGKPETPEEEITGKMYECARDTDLLTLSFSLAKDGQTLFAREPQKHWWLTGFHWGVYSEPEELTALFTIGFPNTDMKRAFLEGGDTGDSPGGSGCYGLTALGYSYEEPDSLSVRFSFARPHSAQPAIREAMRKGTQAYNLNMVQAYNRFKETYHIPNNDPNIISETILQYGGLLEKAIYEKIIRSLPTLRMR